MRTLTRVCIDPPGSRSHSAARSSTTANPNWRLTWSDEFNGPNGTSPDPTKWVYETAGKGYDNHELETYTTAPANVHQQDGHLVITALKEDLTGPDGIPRDYTSARIFTNGHFSQTYGRFEARIRFPPVKASGQPSGSSATTSTRSRGPSPAKSTSSKT